MEQVSITEARGDLAEVINRAGYAHERTVLTRRGRPMAAVVPIEDLELIQRLEDAADLAAIREALADPDNAEPLPWDQVRGELGL